MEAKKPQRMDGYIRVSRRMGREGEGYISPVVQREAIEGWAEYRGIEMIHWELDEDESGGTQNRPGLRRIIARIEAGETDGIACWRLNRFARNVSGAIEDVKTIQAAGGVLSFIEEDIDPTGPFGEFILTVLLAVSTLERDNLVAGWKVSKKKAIDRGAVIGPTAWGYDRDDGLLVPHPTTGPLVTKAFEIAAEQGGDQALAWLQEHATDRTWGTTQLRRLLSNRIYLGEVRWGELLNTDAHKPLTTPGIWHRAQLPERKLRAAAGAFPLTSLMTCGTCGHPMVGGRGGEMQRVYRCTAGYKSYKERRCPAPVVVTAERIEKYVWESLLQAYRAAGTDTVVESQDRTDEELREAADAAETAQLELDRWINDVEMRDILGEEDWRQGMTRRANHRNDAQAALRAASERSSSDAQLSVEVLESIDTPEEQGEVLRAVLDDLTVARGRAAIETRVTSLRFVGADPE